jgi:hypothetical protein
MKTTIIFLIFITLSTSNLIAGHVLICDKNDNCFIFFDVPACADWGLAGGTECTDFELTTDPIPVDLKEYIQLSNNKFAFHYKEPKKQNIFFPIIISSIISGILFFFIGKRNQSRTEK